VLFYFIGGQKILKWIREVGCEHASCVQMTDVTVRWQVILSACAKSDCWFCYVCPSLCLSAWDDSTHMGRIYTKFDFWVFFKNLLGINGTLLEDLCKFMIISHWILLRKRNVSGKSCRENQSTHCMFNNFFPKNHAFM